MYTITDRKVTRVENKNNSRDNKNTNTKKDENSLSDEPSSDYNSEINQGFSKFADNNESVNIPNVNDLTLPNLDDDSSEEESTYNKDNEQNKSLLQRVLSSVISSGGGTSITIGEKSNLNKSDTGKYSSLRKKRSEGEINSIRQSSSVDPVISEERTRILSEMKENRNQIKEFKSTIKKIRDEIELITEGFNRDIATKRESLENKLSGKLEILEDYQSRINSEKEVVEKSAKSKIAVKQNQIDLEKSTFDKTVNRKGGYNIIAKERFERWKNEIETNLNKRKNILEKEMEDISEKLQVTLKTIDKRMGGHLNKLQNEIDEINENAENEIEILTSTMTEKANYKKQQLKNEISKFKSYKNYIKRNEKGMWTEIEEREKRAEKMESIWKAFIATKAYFRQQLLSLLGAREALSD